MSADRTPHARGTRTGGAYERPLPARTDHRRPSRLPAASRVIDSSMRLARVSGFFAMWIHMTKFLRSRGASVWKNVHALRFGFSAFARYEGVRFGIVGLSA